MTPEEKARVITQLAEANITGKRTKIAKLELIKAQDRIDGIRTTLARLLLDAGWLR